VGMMVWVGVGVGGRTADVGSSVWVGELVVAATAVNVALALAIGTWVASGSSGAQAVRRIRNRIIGVRRMIDILPPWV
jgi:hypothetical protein